MMLRILKERVRKQKHLMRASLKAKDMFYSASRLVRRMRKVEYLSTSDYLKTHEGRWHSVYERMPSRLSPLTCFGKQKVDFGSWIVSEFPEMGVLEIPNAYILSPNGWVYNKKRILLPEFSWYGMNVQEMNLPFRLRKPDIVKGVVLTLLSDYGGTNYGHFLLDCISRYHLFTKAGFHLDDCDHILIPGKSTPTRNRLLKRFQIPIEKCLWSDDFPALTADVVLIPSFPGVRINYPEWVATFLRESLENRLIPGKRKIYVSRQRGTRKESNLQTELLPILNKYMFEIYYPEDHEAPEEDFAQAEIIVGPHGAGLTDIVYCSPGTKVLELVPSDHVYPYFYTLASAAKLKYYCLQGASESFRGEAVLGPSPYDFVIDPGEFETAIKFLTDGQ